MPAALSGRPAARSALCLSWTIWPTLSENHPPRRLGPHRVFLTCPVKRAGRLGAYASRDLVPDEFIGWMFATINAMMLDMPAAVARKDYDDRRRRQAQGIAKAKTAGLLKGRKENVERNNVVVAMLRTDAQ